MGMMKQSKSVEDRSKANLKNNNPTG